MSNKKLYLWILTFLRLVGVVSLLAALELWADETKPYGIDKRVLWTTSRVGGSPTAIAIRHGTLLSKVEVRPPG